MGNKKREGNPAQQFVVFNQWYPRVFLSTFNLCGEGGIRTHGGPEGHNGFRDRPDRPLWHLSVLLSAADYTPFMVSIKSHTWRLETDGKGLSRPQPRPAAGSHPRPSWLISPPQAGPFWKPFCLSWVSPQRAAKPHPAPRPSVSQISDFRSDFTFLGTSIRSFSLRLAAASPSSGRCGAPPEPCCAPHRSAAPAPAG